MRGFISFSPSETVKVVDGSGVYAAQMQIRERWQPAMLRSVLVDCQRGLRFDVPSEMAPRSRPDPTEALGEGGDDPIIASVRAGAAPPS